MHATRFMSVNRNSTGSACMHASMVADNAACIMKQHCAAVQYLQRAVVVPVQLPLDAIRCACGVGNQPLETPKCW